MVAKGKRTYWLSSAPTTLHRERIELLALQGFDASLKKNMAEIVAAMGDQRPICIIVDSSSTLAVQKLPQIPELNGVRFILSSLEPSANASRDAVAENYRDILPISLPANEWLQRIQYATATKTSEFPHPQCEISMNQLAVAFAPVRVVWVNETHIRIECRGRMNVGSKLQISGPIAQAFGAKHLSLTVESVHREHLYYRFSQALVCEWRITGAISERATALIRKLHAENPYYRFRAYIAISKAETRKTLINELNRERFEVKAALQRSTLLDELSYYSPDILFMDDRFLGSTSVVDMQLLMSKLPDSAPIVIFGTQVDEAQMKSLFGSRKVHHESHIRLDYIREAVKAYNLTPQKDSEPSAGRMLQILPENPWSRAELQVPARLNSLNHCVGTISLPFSLGTYGAARLEAPILRKALQRDPHIKFTSSSETKEASQSSQFLHQMRFYLADVDIKEKIRLSEVLIGTATSYYEKHLAEGRQFLTQMQNATLTSAAYSSTHGNLALAQPTTGATATVVASSTTSSTDQDQLRKITTRSAKVIQKSVKLDTLGKPFDWTIVKAVLVFALATAIATLLVSLTMNIDSSYYKDNGKEYSDFIRRMTDPEFRKKNPVPSRP